VVLSSVQSVWGESGRVSEELVDRFFELVLRKDNRAALPQRMLRNSHGTRGQEIPKIRQSTLILWGERDQLIPASHACFFHRDIVDSEIQVLDEWGHVPQEEDPQASLAAVSDCLSRQGLCSDWWYGERSAIPWLHI
jgi:pimeloyl-ACP methyl ester carboxylesterase